MFCHWLVMTCHSHSMQCNASQILSPVYNFIIVAQWRHISSESAVMFWWYVVVFYGFFYCLLIVWTIVTLEWQETWKYWNKCFKCVNIWNGSCSDSLQQFPGLISISRAPRGPVTLIKLASLILNSQKCVVL